MQWVDVTRDVAVRNSIYVVGFAGLNNNLLTVAIASISHAVTQLFVSEMFVSTYMYMRDAYHPNPPNTP